MLTADQMARPLFKVSVFRRAMDMLTTEVWT